MKKPFTVHRLFAGLFLACFVASSHANIFLNISPSANQRAVFELSGQFDNQINVELYDLVAFDFATSSIWADSSQNRFDLFGSSLATVVNLTRGGSAEINTFGVYYNAMEFDFTFGTHLTTHQGDTLSLISHGPVTASSTPFAYFIPGHYAYTNPSLGPTTFQITVVPEPSIAALFGLASMALLVLRRRRMD